MPTSIPDPTSAPITAVHPDVQALVRRASPGITPPVVRRLLDSVNAMCARCPDAFDGRLAARTTQFRRLLRWLETALAAPTPDEATLGLLAGTLYLGFAGDTLVMRAATARDRRPSKRGRIAYAPAS